MEPLSYEFALPEVLAMDSWITVTEGGLPQAVAVRVAPFDGEVALTGLCLNSGEVVTSATLRQLRLADLLGQLLGFLLYELEVAFAAAVANAPIREDYLTVDESRANLMVLETWLGRAGPSRAPTVSRVLGQRGRGAKPPPIADLEEFVQIYRDECARGRRGAVTRTAAVTRMSRSTAHRWINLCLQLNLLTVEEKQ